jgi:hypothetical protein
MSSGTCAQGTTPFRPSPADTVSPFPLGPACRATSSLTLSEVAHHVSIGTGSHTCQGTPPKTHCPCRPTPPPLDLRAGPPSDVHTAGAATPYEHRGLRKLRATHQKKDASARHASLLTPFPSRMAGVLRAGPPPDLDTVEAAKPREHRDWRKLLGEDNKQGGGGGGYGGSGQYQQQQQQHGNKRQR